MTDLHLSELVGLFIRLQPWFEKIAQRRENGYCKFAFFSNTGVGKAVLNGKVIFKGIKEKTSTVKDRYMALNLSGYSTIECRMFRGTLCIDSLLAYLRFFHGLVEFVKTNQLGKGSMSKVLKLSSKDLWDLLAKYLCKDLELQEYFRKKKIWEVE